MIFIGGFILFFIISMFIPVWRVFVLGLTGLILAYITWDNLITERNLAASAIQVDAQEVSLFGEGSTAPTAHVTIEVTNRSDIQLQNVNGRLTLYDCVSSNCEPVARKSMSFQVFANAGMARRTDEWVHFSGIPQPMGQLVGRFEVTGGIGDAF